MAGQGLQKKSLDAMLSPQIRIYSKHEFPSLATETTHDNDAIRLSYGLGWGLYWMPDGEAFFKEGHDDGWRNYAVGFLRPKSGIVIMTNSSNGEGVFKELLEILLKDTYTPIEWEGYTPYNLLPPRPALTKHTAVHVDPTVLDKYVGKYKVPGSALIILAIRREGDHLTVQENEEPKQDLMPESETQFFSTVADDVYRFESNDRDQVTTMVLHTDGQDIRIPRQP